MTDAATKKRLGQYFSGGKVANLLIRLCSLDGSEYVIDPMAGNGDMLTAAVGMGISENHVYGIEIDPDAGCQCKKRVSESHIFIGDAFSPISYTSFNRMEWDLVITNPPYVRYQAMSGFENDGLCLKTAKETRQSLSKMVNEMAHLDSDERACFHRIIKNYSGLSDHAVPAWILCAALTRIGGQLAMVVPESWISRDYALSIKYLLLKFFDVEYIVEDSNSAWFPDVLVKTNLLVAKRIPIRKNFDAIQDSAYKHIRFSAELNGDYSLIGKLTIDGETGYAALDNILDSKRDVIGEGFEVRNIHLTSLLSEMSASPVFGKLLQKLEPHTTGLAKAALPTGLRDVMGKSIASINLTDLDAWGFQVGQGLRTGANKFFYTELSESDGDIDYLVTDSLFDKIIIPVAQKYSLPTFRYQSDACGGLVISKPLLSHRLLYIQDGFYHANGNLRDNRDAPLEKHISNAEKLPIELNGKKTYFPNLSAVKPNVRKSMISDGISRGWFMLPPLADRHQPQLCLSRVNYKNARCCLIAEQGIVVDANFSTLWTASQDRMRIYAVFALMNSIWVQSYLETTATIMGGGALKVEASHIRKLLLPHPTDKLIVALYRLGVRLAEADFSEHENLLKEINYAVIQSLSDDADVHEKCSALWTYLQSKVNGRQR